MVAKLLYVDHTTHTKSLANVVWRFLLQFSTVHVKEYTTVLILTNTIGIGHTKRNIEIKK